MSHYSVAIIHTKDESIEDILSPFDENLEVDFINVEDEARDRYNNGYEKAVVDSNGEYILYDSRYAKDYQNVKNIPIKDIFKDFDSFMEYHGCDFQDGIGYGYWSNKNAKWDWYQVGGRFSGFLVSNVDGSSKDEIPIDEWDIDYTEDGKYDSMLAEWDCLIDKNCYPYGMKYMIDRYDNANTYASICCTNFTYAVITPDGEWHSPGTVGWWGYSSDTGKEFRDWVFNFKDNFYNPYLNKDYIVTIVDAHI